MKSPMNRPAQSNTTSSINLPPLNLGSFMLFVTSQFCAKAQMPPKDLSLAGQTAIISGSNSGLGFTCAGMLLDQGLSRLIMAVRSQERGEAAAATLRAKHPSATIEVWALDMLSYQSIQAFAERCSTLSCIDIVILNAGLIKENFQLSPDGHEETVQVNYLSTALLAILLLPILKAKKPAGKPARLTIVNSGTSMMAKFAEHDKVPLLSAFDDEANFDANDRYQTSKLLGMHFIIKLVEYVNREDVIVNCVDPGFCKGSGLHRHLSGPLRAVFGAAKAVSGRSLEEGASTYIDAAVIKGAETHGSYLMDWTIFPFASFIYTPEGKTTTERLWEETMKEFDFAGVRAILSSLQSGSR